MAIMEVTRLRVKPDKAGRLQDTRRAMLAAFSRRPGFVRAELARVADDEWLDLIVWETSADFAESRRRGADSPAVSLFFDQIDAVLSSEEGRLWSRSDQLDDPEAEQ